ncbi:MAG: molybdenum cofactor guanylyltransferase [Bacteroidales bacterium]
MKISGFILAGGRSSRFGSNKAFASFDRKLFIERSIETLLPLCSSVSISGNYDEYSSFNYPLIKDQIDQIGPIGGIYSCLKSSTTHINLFLTCDMPLLTSKIVSELIPNLSDADVRIYGNSDSIRYPFPGIYCKTVLPEIEDLILKDDFKIKSLLSRVSVSELKIEDSIRKQFSNINYRDQLLEISSI